jgi:hypothetical protein
MYLGVFSGCIGAGECWRREAGAEPGDVIEHSDRNNITPTRESMPTA